MENWIIKKKGQQNYLCRRWAHRFIFLFIAKITTFFSRIFFNDRDFINLINIQKFLIFPKFTCLLGKGSIDICCSKIWNSKWQYYLLFQDLEQQMAIQRYAGTWKWRSEECNNFYSIENAENDADELKAKVWLVGISPIGLPNRTYPGRARQDLSATCVQGDTKGSFVPFHEHWHFHQSWTQFCLNR